MKRKSVIIIGLIFVSLAATIFASTVRIKGDTVLGSLQKEVFTFIGNVFINKDGEIYVETPLATATKGTTDWESFVTEGETFVRFQTGEATSSSLDYNLENSTGTLLEDVEAIIYSKEDDGKDIYVYRTEILNFDQKTEYYEGFAKETKEATPNLIFIDYKGDLNVDTLYFEYFGDTGLLNLRGNVFVDDFKNSRKIWAAELIYDTNDDSFEGKDVEIELVF
ncbi:MAG: OstA family protein [Mesotoga sp.]|jgi:lipopolysaccharide export system protein LptA|uniref:OstA family protein n=1 Tax=unclassified Mesotoga TaxID=1184398 RepID=UPI000EF20A1F|nr:MULTISPECIES: OstA family protein [unclassified Mesotoga]MDI9368683.1 OstA family protein [Thermotogota bacterium]MDD2333054.1 OstA family protein [Mesotoga sp.]MDD3680411.1 OstA family protein [Mesotoga sp.]MDD4207243.1 OstA family protein [Mesotoga sp.]MDD4825301.1 OstA family protein [Mesotoga sp.]